jgi:hypothetical protein
VSALAFMRQLRGSRDTWHREIHGIDVSAIEHMDRAISSCCVKAASTSPTAYSRRIEMALLVTLELPPTTAGRVQKSAPR